MEAILYDILMETNTAVSYHPCFDCCYPLAFHLVSNSRGGHSVHTETGGQSEKFSGNQLSVQLYGNPKILANFILRNL